MAVSPGNILLRVTLIAMLIKTMKTIMMNTTMISDIDEKDEGDEEGGGEEEDNDDGDDDDDYSDY